MMTKITPKPKSRLFDDNDEKEEALEPQPGRPAVRQGRRQAKRNAGSQAGRRSCQESQGGTRATSATKFKNFFFDEPETSSEKKSSASRDRTSDIKKPKLDKDQDQEEDEERKRKPVTYKSINDLFEKVVLVISGTQNPERANLRNQALAMGVRPLFGRCGALGLGGRSAPAKTGSAQTGLSGERSLSL
ncbi:uncharacterized protein LOC120428894 [Culex pipiens pallens]|uniref:uncharacterized protein LOC120428894 n=1 Tax=Culex pipiens pallens TaxID=42434 RepID=UPI001952A6DB|nr:uncharacterized protein LOC120428894 [Culex pipiens pallens]XP_039449967.1 uncharacterized protein LOC120428894 [Culex pipiens pallens]